MTVSYRAVLRLDDHEDAIRAANQQFRSWLAERMRDQRNTSAVADWDGPGEHVIGPDSTLTVVEHHGDDGSVRQLLELVEKTNAGVWTTRCSLRRFRVRVTTDKWSGSRVRGTASMDLM
jgi:hypothetical protein